jgi:hypothetical protein
MEATLYAQLMRKQLAHLRKLIARNAAAYSTDAHLMHTRTAAALEQLLRAYP